MPNVNAVLAQEIVRLSKRTINSSTKVTRKLVASHRHDLATLKQQIATLTKRLALVEKKAPKEVVPPPELLEKGRFRAIGVKAHRAKLGLSAANYGKLVGVSEVTIYMWESGKTTPQKAQKARWLAIRGLGKREALERLGMAESKSAPVVAKAAAKSPKVGKFGQTAEEMLLMLLKGGKALVSKQINVAWKKAGRGGTADKALGLLVKAKKLKRVTVLGARGSGYIAAGHHVVAAKPAPRQTRKRGTFKQTAEEMILGLLKGRKALTTKELAGEWKKAGRGGKVDNVLGTMVAAKKLKRKPLGGKMGSEYSVA